jgi:hypothetical protein
MGGRLKKKHGRKRVISTGRKTEEEAWEKESDFNREEDQERSMGEREVGG